MAQYAAGLIGDAFRRGVTGSGALTGTVVGCLIWVYTLFLPSFGGEVILSLEVLREGPWGISALWPQALFGMKGMDTLVHAIVWSVGMNTLTFLIVSSLTVRRR